MATVDPYIERIPAKFLEDPETREWAFYLNRWLHDMWVRTGAGSDNINKLKIGDLFEGASSLSENLEGLEVDLATSPVVTDLTEKIEALEVDHAVLPLLSDLSEKIEALEIDLAQLPAPVTLKVLEPRTMATGDTTLTTTGDECVTCLNTAAGTVTLNANPDDGEDCIISRRDALVTVMGDINGATSLAIGAPFNTPHLKFSLAAGEWMIV